MTLRLGLTCLGLAMCLTGCEMIDRSAAPAEPYDVIIVDGDEAEPIAFPLLPTRRLAGPETNIAGMSFFEHDVPAQSAGAPPHTHSHEDEFFYVREGQVTFMADDQRQTLSAGGFILLPRGSLHAFWNDTDDDAILLVGASEGQFGDFFDAVAIEAQKQQPKSPQEMGLLLDRISAERGIKIDMSKLPPDVAALYGMPGQ